MKIKLPNVVVRKTAGMTLKLQQNSPHILFGAGVVLSIGTVVAACKASLRLEEVIDTGRNDLEDMNKLVEAGKWPEDRNINADRAAVYGITARRLTVLYGPAAIMGVASLLCFAQSHRIMTKRNAALSAAYVALDKAYRNYRARVVTEVGEDREREIYNQVETTTKTSTVNGKKKVDINKAGNGGLSGYSRLFDVNNINWSDNPDYRIAFLRLSQNQLNDQLNAKGYLFLNDVYDQLGFDRTTAGQVVGWISNANENAKDGYLDFGVFADASMEKFHNFHVHGEPIWINFNVDGPIYEMLKEI